GGGVTVWKADHRADLHLISHIIPGFLYETGRYAHRSRMIEHGVVAEPADLLPCGGLRQKCMVYSRENFLISHGSSSLSFQVAFIIPYRRVNGKLFLQEGKPVLLKSQYPFVPHFPQFAGHGAAVHGEEIRKLLTVERDLKRRPALSLRLVGKIGKQLFPGGPF